MPHFTQVWCKRHLCNLVSRHPRLTYLSGFKDTDNYWFRRCHQRGFVSGEPRVFGSQPAMICGLRSPTGAPRLAAIGSRYFPSSISTAKVFTFSLCDISNNYQQWERGKCSLYCQLRSVEKISDRNSRLPTICSCVRFIIIAESLLVFAQVVSCTTIARTRDGRAKSTTRLTPSAT